VTFSPLLAKSLLKGSEMSCTKKLVNLLLVAALFLTPIVAAPQQTDQGGTALREGRRLLKRGQADKALIQLRNALNLYTAAKNNSGIAAAHKELGDLFMRQGQYQIALDHYQKAFDGFFAGNPKQDAVASGVA
jgi:tetratricopeptide (TPR) repeat protein